MTVMLAMVTGAMAYDITGSVANDTGKSGRIYIGVQRSDGVRTGLGVSIPAAGPFTIRGVPSGTYSLHAFMDTRVPATGTRHASDPFGKSAPVSVDNAAVTAGADIALQLPTTPILVPPEYADAVSGDGTALVMWDPAETQDGAEIANYYTVYWSDTPDPGPANFKGKSPVLPSDDDQAYLVTGLANGSTLYFGVTALLAKDGTESAAAGANEGEALVIGPKPGGYTVSGTVDSTGIAKTSGATSLWVAAVADEIPVAFARIAAPADLQAYSLAGVPSGSYRIFAILDMNGNQVIDAGDYMVGDEEAPLVTVATRDLPGANLSILPRENRAAVSVGYWHDGNTPRYSLGLSVDGAVKLPVNVSVSGPQIAGILDMAPEEEDGGGRFRTWTGVPNRPLVAPTPDSYSFSVSFADGSTTSLSAQVTGVVESLATPVSPVGLVQTMPPTFTWTAPANPPASTYFYHVNVDGDGFHWHSPPIPSSELSVTYGFDDDAPRLTPGRMYNWRVSISDLQGNNAGGSSLSFSVASMTAAANGVYSYNPATGMLSLDWRDSDFVCDGPEPGPESQAVTELTATSMTWVDDATATGTMTWTRTSGASDSVVGTWSLTEQPSGNSYALTFNADGTVSATGTIYQCGGDGGGQGAPLVQVVNNSGTALQQVQVGDVVFTENLSCGDGCSGGFIEVMPGVKTIFVQQPGTSTPMPVGELAPIDPDRDYAVNIKNVGTLCAELWERFDLSMGFNSDTSRQLIASTCNSGGTDGGPTGGTDGGPTGGTANATLSGHIFNGSGQGVCGASVSAYGPAGAGHATTSSEGSYTLALPAGDYTLSLYYAPGDPNCANAEAYPSFSKQGIAVTLAGQTVQDLSLPQSYTVSGRVVDQSGSGIAGAGIAFMPAPPEATTATYTSSAYPSAFATSATDGSYSVALYGGTYSVSLSQNQQFMNVATGVLVEASLMRDFTWIPQPQIYGFFPTSAAMGTDVTIDGSGFGAPGYNELRFNGAHADIVSWSDSQIVATVPYGATSGPISLSTQGWRVSSDASFTVMVEAPEVVHVLPPSGAAGMPLNGGIMASFNQKMDGSSVNGSTFTVRDGSGATVAGQVQWQDDAFVFVPALPLEPGQAYTATLGTGIRTVQGAALASPYRWSFTTAQGSTGSFPLRDGIFFLETDHDGPQPEYLYAMLQLAADGSHLTETWYGYQPLTGTWASGSTVLDDEQYYSLTDSGWQLVSDAPGAGTVAASTDGSFTWTNSADGTGFKMEPVVYNLAGRPLADFVNPEDLPVAPTGSYPAGSQAYLFRSTALTDTYRIHTWTDESQVPDQNYVRYWDGTSEQIVPQLADLPKLFATGQTQRWLHLDGALAMQLGAQGEVQLFRADPQAPPAPITATATWEYLTVKNQQLLVVNLPPEYRPVSRGRLFFAELNGLVKTGEWIAAGTQELDSYPNYNQTAFGWLVGATVAKLPGAPTGVNAGAGNAQAAVSFIPPASNGGSAITGYTVTSTPAGGVDNNAGTLSTVHLVTGLQNGVAYSFTVTATNSVGSGAVSAASAAVTPSASVPGAPAITGVTPGNAQATVTFTAPTQDGGSAITGYTVVSNPAGGVDQNAGTTGTVHTVTGLANGTPYTFTVTASSSAGTGAASAPSGMVIPVTVPGAPTNVAAMAGYGQALITFGPPQSNGGSAVTRYTVTSTPGNFSAGAPAGPIRVTGLANGTAYTFTVTATSAVGTGTASAPSNSVTPTDLLPPVVRGFSVPGSVGAPDTATSVTIPISSFFASDNDAVAGFLVTATADKPAATAAGWSAVAPTGFDTNTTPGPRTLFAWAKDATGNVSNPYIAMVAVTPVDTTAPVILAGPMVTSLSDSTAVVEWLTNEPAAGGVKYGTDAPLAAGGTENYYGTRHFMTISGLSADTNYYVSVFATDLAGNGPTQSKEISLRTKAAPDTAAPYIIEGPTLTAIGPDAVTVQWRTNEPARGSVFYGTTNTLGDSIAEEAFSTQHSVKVTGLSAETQYYLKVTATDLVGNGPRESGQARFRTVALPDTIAPVLVERPMAVNIADTGATVLWKTDEPASSLVIVYDGANYSFFSDNVTRTSHTVTLTGLTESTPYSYQVIVTDGSGNSRTVTVPTAFWTKAAPDIIPPVITEGPIVAEVTHDSAALRWGTDEPADSVIEYGTTESFGSELSSSTPVRTHHLTLTGLEAGTRYYYRVTSTDTFGNGPSVSRVFSVTTKESPSFKVPVITVSPTVIYKTDTSMTIYWETDDPSDSVVEYGVNDTLTDRVSNSDKVTKHQITITNLVKNTAYKVVVSSTNMSGNRVYARSNKAVRRLALNLGMMYTDAGGDVVPLGDVTTAADPDIVAPEISTGATPVTGITDTQAVVNWTTNEIADSVVQYGVQGGAMDLSAGDPAQVTDHMVVLTNLQPATTYAFTVSSTDPSGNGPVSSGVLTFTTAAAPDTTAPSLVGAMIIPYQDGTGKTTISWSTDEPSSTQLKYGTSPAAMTSQAATSGLSTDHTLTLALQPGTTYYAAAVVMDSSGNVAETAPLEFATMGSVDATAPVISVSPAGGTYLGAQTVTLSANEPATIYYTTDGSTPTASSTQYSGPVGLAQSGTLRYFAIDAAGNQEAAQDAAYVIQYAIAASSADGNGSITCPEAVSSGETGVCTAVPADGYQVGGITGCGGTFAGASYTTGAITADCGVTASFSPVTTFTVTPAASGNGSLSPSTAQTVAEGAIASFTVTPADGYQVLSVTGCGGSLSGTTYTTAAASESCSVTATFTPLTFTVTPAESSNGSLSPATAQTVAQGATASFTVTPADGYEVLSVTGCAGSLSGTTYTTAAASESCTVTATFGLVPTTPVILGDLNGDGSVDLADALRALRISVGIVTPSADDLARDVGPLVNGAPAPDGKIDVSDALVLLKKAVGLLSW